MKKEKLSIIISLIIFCSCNNKQTNNTTATDVILDTTENTILHTNSEVSDAPIEENINFQEYKNVGFIIGNKLLIYNTSFELIDSINLPNSITEVQIIAKTDKMKSVSGDIDDICSLTYFLKIIYNGSEYIIDGFSINVIEEDEPIINIETNQDTIELISIIKIAIGSFDPVYELTGCDDYSPILVKDKDHYHLIDNVRDDYYVDKNKINYFYLRHDEGIHEEIIDTSLNNDTIIATIRKNYQDGWSKYNLNIVKNNDKYTSYINNETEISYD